MRPDILARAGAAWIVRQGQKAGFLIHGRADDGASEAGEAGFEVRVSRYRTLDLMRRPKPARLGILDLEGVLQVREPDRFLEALTAGFGRAKAFGCGLMLIRRV
jgi:CRISPR system Cascade subunit CasE